MNKIPIKLCGKIYTRFDWRVNFKNLKSSKENVNHLSSADMEIIWLPVLIFSNSIEETVLKFDKFCAVIVQKMGQPVQNSQLEIYENEIFYGENNPFVYNRTYELQLACMFELQKYPFDYQHCFIDVRLLD